MPRLCMVKAAKIALREIEYELLLPLYFSDRASTDYHLLSSLASGNHSSTLDSEDGPNWSNEFPNPRHQDFRQDGSK